MNLDRLKSVNEEIIDKASEKIENNLSLKKWDNEDFTVLSQAVDNILDICKIEKYKYGEKEIEMYTMPKQDPTKVTTDFEALVYKVAEKHPGKNGMIALTTVLAETMEDLRIYNPRLYDSTLRRLKEMLV